MEYKTAFDWFPSIYNKERYYNFRKVIVHQVDLSRDSREGYSMYMSLEGDVYANTDGRYEGELRALHFFTMKKDWHYIIIEDIIIPRIEIPKPLLKSCCEEIESRYRGGLYPDLTYYSLIAAADDLKFECYYVDQHSNLKNQPVAVNSLIVAFQNDNEIFSDEPQPNGHFSNFKNIDIGFLDIVFGVQDRLRKIFEDRLKECAYENGYGEIVNRYYFED